MLYVDPSLYSTKNILRSPTPDPSTGELFSCGILGMEMSKLPFAVSRKEINEFTPSAMAYQKRLHDTLEMLITIGHRHFLTSGAPGIEMWAAEMLLDLRDTHEGIALEIVIPYDDICSRWSYAYQNRFEILLEEADILTGIAHEKCQGITLRRNHYLLAASHTLLASYVPGKTYTEKVARRASLCGKQVVRLPVLSKTLAA